MQCYTWRSGVTSPDTNQILALEQPDVPSYGAGYGAASPGSAACAGLGCPGVLLTMLLYIRFSSAKLIAVTPTDGFNQLLQRDFTGCPTEQIAGKQQCKVSVSYSTPPP